MKVVFSKRKGETKIIALVTDDLRATAPKVVADYLKRWAVELLIKDETQQPGLEDVIKKSHEKPVIRRLELLRAA